MKITTENNFVRIACGGLVILIPADETVADCRAEIRHGQHRIFVEPESDADGNPVGFYVSPVEQWTETGRTL